MLVYTFLRRLFCALIYLSWPRPTVGYLIIDQVTFDPNEKKKNGQFLVIFTDSWVHKYINVYFQKY